MEKMTLQILIFICIFFLNSCEKNKLSLEEGDIKIEIETGNNWLHDFPLLLGLKKKNPPQFAIWIEDTSGNYISSVFVTHKIATESWQANQGNRRKESLPHWCWQRAVIYEDGLLLPTKKNPLTDGITGETPKKNKTIHFNPISLIKPLVIKAEFNHSVDFNEHYPENATEGDDNYSGGPEGSGQPAVVYADTVYFDTHETELKLIGHSSPDGSDGIVYKNTIQ